MIICIYILRIKIEKMRKLGRSQSFLEWGKFYAEWNNYSYAAHYGVFLSHPIFRLTKCEHKGVNQSMDFDDRNFSSVKPQRIFQFFSNQNILFQECSKKNQTYISNILSLFEYIRFKTKNMKMGRSRSFLQRA